MLLFWLMVIVFSVSILGTLYAFTSNARPVLWAHTRGHVIQGCTVHVEGVALTGLQQGTTLRVLKCNRGHCATANFSSYI